MVELLKNRRNATVKGIEELGVLIIEVSMMKSSRCTERNSTIERRCPALKERC
jgi:hypothetical protein